MSKEKNPRKKIRRDSGGLRKCPSDEEIDSYLLNKLDKKREKEIDRHLFECQRCFQRVLEKKDLIDGVKIVFKNSSDFLEKAIKKTTERIINGEKIKRVLKEISEK